MIQKVFLKKNQKQDFFERYSENRSIASPSNHRHSSPINRRPSSTLQILESRFYFYTISLTEDYP
jgi:hypothetical protein